MKKGAILLLSLLYTFTLLSQSTDQLDNKYGFKHFKLHSSPSDYVGEIKYVESWDPNPKIQEYLYIGDKIDYLFGVKVEKISLIFYEGELMSISISFGIKYSEFKEDEYNRILYSLKELYGTPYNIDLNDPDFIKYGGKKWVGNLVSMEILRLYYKPTKRISGYITIAERSLHKKRIRDEF